MRPASSNYHFNLYSNFTFLLRDSINGDEIAQTDGRNIYGYTGTYDRDHELFDRSLHSTFGLGTRIDDSKLQLRNAVQRRILDTVSTGQLYEQNINAYLDETLNVTDRLTVNAAVRADVFVFQFRGQASDEAGVLAPLSGRKTYGRVSPKLNLYYQLSPGVQLFARSGFGFHSNDARGVIQGTVKDNPLPRALGYEVGSTFKPLPDLIVNAALWSLHLQDELIYVGDEAVVESAGETQRYGVDVSFRYQATKLLFLDADFNYNHGRSVNDPEGQNYIPLAPTFTSVGGLTLKSPKGFSASLRYRHIDSRPANEDNTVRARGYFLFDGVMSYTTPRFQLGATAENLLNVKWNEAQFDTLTRIPGDPAAGAPSELHFTPGTPFYVKVNASVFF